MDSDVCWAALQDRGGEKGTQEAAMSRGQAALVNSTYGHSPTAAKVWLLVFKLQI